MKSIVFYLSILVLAIFLTLTGVPLNGQDLYGESRYLKEAWGEAKKKLRSAERTQMGRAAGGIRYPFSSC